MSLPPPPNNFSFCDTLTHSQQVLWNLHVPIKGSLTRFPSQTDASSKYSWFKSFSYVFPRDSKQLGRFLHKLIQFYSFQCKSDGFLAVVFARFIFPTVRKIVSRRWRRLALSVHRVIFSSWSNLVVVFRLGLFKAVFFQNNLRKECNRPWNIFPLSILSTATPETAYLCRFFFLSFQALSRLFWKCVWAERDCKSNRPFVMYVSSLSLSWRTPPLAGWNPWLADPPPCLAWDTWWMVRALGLYVDEAYLFIQNRLPNQEICIPTWFSNRNSTETQSLASSDRDRHTTLGVCKEADLLPPPS